MRTTRYTLAPDKIEWLKSNRHLLNAEIAPVIGRSHRSVARILRKLGLERNPEHLQACRMEAYERGIHKAIPDQRGSKNPCWKNGISKNHVHYLRIQEQRYPERVAARRMVMKAVAAKTLIRLPCVICGEAKTQGHHQDYSKPLDVIWLCRPCHRGLHSGKLTVQLAGETVSVTPANLDVWAKGNVSFPVPILTLPTPPIPLK